MTDKFISIEAIAKRYPGQARRVMMGLWRMLPQFCYTKAMDTLPVRRHAVQAIGAETSRYPLAASQWRIKPGSARVRITSFRRQSALLVS